MAKKDGELRRSWWQLAEYWRGERDYLRVAILAALPLMDRIDVFKAKAILDQALDYTKEVRE